MLTEAIYRCSMYENAPDPMSSRSRDVNESLGEVSGMSVISSRREGKRVEVYLFVVCGLRFVDLWLRTDVSLRW